MIQEIMPMLVLKDNGAALTARANALDDDKHAGFIRAVNNGQVRQALEYAIHLFTELNNEIFYLKEALEKAPKVEPVKAVKKTRAKAAPKAKKEATEAVPNEADS